MDAGVFLSHFQDTVVDSQAIYGMDKAQFTGVAPTGRFNFPGGGSGWADAGVIVPWTVWQMTGDAAIVKDNWPAMTRYLDWIQEQTGDTYAGQGSLTGDWLGPQKTSAQLMSDVYYGYSTRLMAQLARAIGRTAEGEAYDRLFGRIKQAFITKYLSTEGGTVTVKSSLGDASPIEPGSDPNQKTEDNSQTALLWVLKLGFYEKEAQRRTLVGLLADNIGNDAAYKAAHPNSIRVRYAENTLSVGFLGVNVLAPVLTDEGRADLAYELLHQDALPSWLFSVKNGATTVWERWNSYSKTDGFGPVGMNSFNHYAYGAIMEWMYAYMAGIARDPESPGFKHFLLQPTSIRRAGSRRFRARTSRRTARSGASGRWRTAAGPWCTTRSCPPTVKRRCACRPPPPIRSVKDARRWRGWTGYVSSATGTAWPRTGCRPAATTCPFGCTDQRGSRTTATPPGATMTVPVIGVPVRDPRPSAGAWCSGVMAAAQRGGGDGEEGGRHAPYFQR